jgi:hypothetical protein
MGKTLSAVLVMLVVCMCGSANADLIDNGGGLIYDSDLNITWYDNPNYEYHPYLDFVPWVNSLVVEGTGGWRLPTTPGTMTRYTGEGELGHLYTELGNVVGDSCSQTAPFKNFSTAFYTNTFYTSTSNIDGFIYVYSFEAGGYQDLAQPNLAYYWIHALAVHDGNIGADVAPISPSLWLFASGLVGLVGLRKFRSS